jgi:hypothetical protein
LSQAFRLGLHEEPALGTADEQAPGHTPADVGHYAGNERPVFCLLIEQRWYLLYSKGRTVKTTPTARLVEGTPSKELCN